MAQESEHAQQLRAMLEEGGKLKIITSEHACGAGKHPSIKGFKAGTCAKFKHDLYDPRHFVIHDVVEIVGPGPNGAYRALSAEGDRALGMAETLVKRLQEATVAKAS